MIVSIEEARSILGEDAVGMTDAEILNVINTLDLLAKDALQEAQRRIRMKKDAKALAELVYDVYQEQKMEDRLGKEVESSGNSFSELKAYTDEFYAGNLEKVKVFEQTYALLAKYGVRLRQKDGNSPKMTISVPNGGNKLVVGIRYIKENKRNTEDHFLFRPHRNLFICKGKALDKILPEYKGSHIQQIAN